ncbi:dynamin family protein [Clostridium sp. BJN0001]|uniref:dynamin family protein n=1 Tax=Clostridium sp. BJN0001 TaxID=2930219 RepID=UPI001FD37F9D|nr:dynamin family protein [Clostridium sp. BJN0001]
MNKKLLKEGFKRKFLKLKSIADKYNLEINFIDDFISEIDDFKVITPVIGGFGTGKSSLINAVLQDDILKTNIESKNSITTEISYSDKDNVKFLKDDKVISDTSVCNYTDKKYDVDDYDLVKIEYNNDVLEKIKNVKIVDMPGFDSGIELHKKAIDKYLTNSLSYIIVFSADNIELTQSVKNFLREINLHDIPIFIIINKCDKVSKSKIEEDYKKVNDIIEKYLPKKGVKVGLSKSKIHKNVRDVTNILLQIESDSEKIIKNEFSRKLKNLTLPVDSYINSKLSNMKLTDKELVEKEEELQMKSESNYEKVEKEKQEFNKNIPLYIENVQRKVDEGLKDSTDKLVEMILNDEDIKEKINYIVRKNVIMGIKAEFEPVLKKYLTDVVSILKIDAKEEIKLDEFKVSAGGLIENVVVNSVPIVLMAVGAFLAGPLIGLVGGLAGVCFDAILKNSKEKLKKAEIENMVSKKIIPEVSKKSGECIKREISKYVEEINKSLELIIDHEKEVMMKAILDVKNENKFDALSKNDKVKALINDLKVVRQL